MLKAQQALSAAEVHKQLVHPSVTRDFQDFATKALRRTWRVIGVLEAILPFWKRLPDEMRNGIIGGIHHVILYGVLLSAGFRSNVAKQHMLIDEDGLYTQAPVLLGGNAQEKPLDDNVQKLFPHPVVLRFVASLEHTSGSTRRYQRLQIEAWLDNRHLVGIVDLLAVGAASGTHRPEESINTGLQYDAADSDEDEDETVDEDERREEDE